jgi:ATP:ADP antiporter, AAA family
MLFDYLFKGAAQDALKSRDALSRFFTIYYAAVGFLTFVLQTSSSRQVLERFGLRAAVSSPSVALLAGGVGTLAVPGLASAVAVRGAESACRVSLFRAGYELFYAPIAPAEKRAVKSIVDVGADRLGDAAASGLIPLLLLAPAAIQRSAIVWVGIACSALALVLANRLNRGYIQTLEKSLLDRAVDLDLSDVEDRTTRATILRTLGRSAAAGETRATAVDADVIAILALRSGDPDAARRVLHDERALSATLVPCAIRLLARSSLAADTITALRKVAEEHVGALVDALLDPNQEFVVRRRLARVFSICVSQRAVDGLLLAFDDLRFEVRFQCARSLAVIIERNRSVRVDRQQVFAAVQREVQVARSIWDGRRLVDDVSVDDPPSAVDEFVQPRVGQSLAHVFTLLALVLPKDPLQIAFRGLQTDDRQLRGTALEYLEGILPQPIREALWPFLEGAPASGPPAAAKVDAGG